MSQIDSLTLGILDDDSGTLLGGTGKLGRCNYCGLSLGRVGLGGTLRNDRRLVLARARSWPVVSRHLGGVARHRLAAGVVWGLAELLSIRRDGRLVLSMHVRVDWVARHGHPGPHVWVVVAWVEVLWNLCRPHWRGLIVVWRHVGRHIGRLRHRRRKGWAAMLWRGGAEVLLSVVAEVAGHSTASLVGRAASEVVVWWISHVLLVIVISATTATTLGVVSSTHGALGRSLGICISLAVARSSSHVRGS